MPHLAYLQNYPEHIVAQVQQLLDQDKLGDWLLAKHPECHAYRSERALYDYTMDLKKRHLRKAPALSKVIYDPKIHAIQNALGLHTRVSRIQGSKLKAKYEIRVATVFRQGPLAFLDMILIHELAHFKEHDHNKAFYKLCAHMDPDYHQMEFDLRVYLTYKELVGVLYSCRQILFVPRRRLNPVPSHPLRQLLTSNHFHFQTAKFLTQRLIDIYPANHRANRDKLEYLECGAQGHKIEYQCNGKIGDGGQNDNFPNIQTQQ